MKEDAAMRGNSTLPVVVGLIVASTLIEAVLLAGDLGLLPAQRLRATANEFAGFWPGLLKDWRPNYPFQDWLMFLSYGFLHAGPVHLALNMVTLLSLGFAVGTRVGGLGFSILYIASILGGAVGFALLTEGYRPMVGASGALFGLAGALLAWELSDRFSMRKHLWPVARAVLMLATLNIALYFAMGGLLAWETHLGGFVAGWCTALVIGRRQTR